MDVENKYYTPSIEEFHVGFEYESEEDPRLGHWEKQVVNENTLLKYFSDKSDVEHRVKYLDREDIESYGFKFVRETSKFSVFCLKTEARSEYLFLTYYLDSRQILLLNGEDFNDNITYFDGIVKNKSEFKRILKQISYFKNAKEILNNAPKLLKELFD